VAVSLVQLIGSTDALRTGSYCKTLTFTLSTTTPQAFPGARKQRSGVLVRPATPEPHRSGIEKRRSPAQLRVTAMEITTTTSGVNMTGSSTQGIKTVLHPVSDLAAAKAVYAALLGVPPQTDESYYVGFEADGQHIGLVPGGGPQGMTSPVAYWQVPDIETRLAEVTAAGATVKESAHDVGGGRLVATVIDPDGNVLGLLQDR
jgi:predicted enzyme related to lactoylglutathione lyase